MVKLVSDRNNNQAEKSDPLTGQRIKLFDELIPDMDAHLLVGRRIVMRRKEMKITTKTLAKRIGISQQQLSRYERGTNRININHLIAIGAELNTPISWFFIDCYSNEEKEDTDIISSYSPIEGNELKKRLDQIWPHLSYGQHRTLILFLDECLKS